MNLITVNTEEYLSKIAVDEGSRIHRPSNWFHQIAERLYAMQNNLGPEGDKLPWSKTHDHVRLRPGELSLWAGMNAHRKSMCLGWIMAHLANDCSVAIASLEMKPEETMLRMARQCVGSSAPGTDAVGDFIKWADNDRLWFYDELDKVPWRRILGFVYYAAKELNCKHIVIDSLTKCGISQGDGEAEKEFIDRLQWAAKTLNTHIHLVCHVRKPHSAGEEYVPNKFDVRGAGELTDLADNLFIVWKDKRRENLVQSIDQFGPDSLEQKDRDYLSKSSDQKLIVAKQRHGAWEGVINLYFHGPSLQFVSKERRRMDFQYNMRELVDYAA